MRHSTIPRGNARAYASWTGDRDQKRGGFCMSFQQDYLLRMLQDVAGLMTRIVRMRRQGENEEALALLVGESSRLSGIPESLVYALSDDDLVNTLQARGVLETERCYALAELFREEGEIYLDRNQPVEASLRLTKAVRL